MGLSFQATISCDNCPGTATCSVICHPSWVPDNGVSVPLAEVFGFRAIYPDGWKVGLKNGQSSFWCPSCAIKQPNPVFRSPFEK